MIEIDTKRVCCFFASFVGVLAEDGWFGLKEYSALASRLRTGWTWVCLTASIGATMALATWWDVGGLPALPLLALGFLLPNADVLYREVRVRLAKGPPRSPR